uniref:CD93 molecule n=1 Tax=Astyanax mexicanus TaxID=7994 RepID=A0A8B9JAT2_ASTMX
MRALLLALSALVAARRAVGQAATTRCTERACFTLHAKKAPFDVAKTLCYDNGGYLLTMRDQEEAEDARALLALAREAGLFMRGEEKLWIGLKLAKGSCVLDEESLRGFRWESGARDSTKYINWGREPRSTCTEERCVSVRASTAGSVQLEWSDGSCKDSALYACRFQFKGMCEPLTLAGPGDITYTTPFSDTPLHEGISLRMLPHATFADITCTSSKEHYYLVICKEAGAGFSWTPAGPFCPSGERTCAHQNGGCQHVCSDEGDPGMVRCSCREGYYLGDDTITCFPNNPCKNAPCVHKCVSEGASLRCTCHKGYQLAQDEVDCIDVNECEESVCGVHACHNLPGSYECACDKGFEKGAGGACVDVDECAKGACGRSANCLNSQGSFSCYCSMGFRPSSDADEGCVDVDECVNRPCEDICTNTVGSFSCSCRGNFRLADNGISCIQVIMEPSPRAPASHQPPTTGGHEETTTTTATTATSTLTLPFSSESSSTEAEDTLSRSWVLVWVLGSVIPLLLLVALTSVIAVLRWNRARKEAKKKNATADNYCWVSSGFQIQPENEPN